MEKLKQSNENLIKFRVTDQTLGALEERGETGQSPSLVAQDMIDCHLYMLQRHLPRFTENEAMLLADAMNGCMLDYYTASLLWANIADALETDGLDGKWHVDGKALVERLRSLTPFEQWAIYDAIRRAWNSETYRVKNMEERVKQVGLVKEA